MDNDVLKSVAHLGKQETKKFTNGHRWGNWQLDTDGGILEYLMVGSNGPSYSIRLFEIGTSPAMLGWIFQVRAKAWTNEEDMGCLLNAFYDLFDPQANLCSGEQDLRIKDPKAFLLEVFG